MFEFNFYNKLKEKHKNNYRQSEYISELICDLASLFNAKTDNIRFVDIVRFACESGGCIISKGKDGELKAWCGSSASKKRQNGEWDKITGFSDNGETFKGTNGIDCVVVHFNPFRETELSIFRYADMFVECDISTDLNVYYSRYNPIILCEDDNIKTSIEHALNNIRIGKPITILNKRLMKKFIGDGTNNDTSILNISDVKNSDKIQYLSEYHEALKRRFYTKYGCPLSSSTKHAQVNVGEISGAENVSKLYVTQVLEELKRGFDSVNNLFGVSWSVEFSDYVKMPLLNENGGGSDDSVIKDDIAEDNK